MKYLVYLVEEVRNEGHQFTLELHLHSDHIHLCSLGTKQQGNYSPEVGVHYVQIIWVML